MVKLAKSPFDPTVYDVYLDANVCLGQVCHDWHLRGQKWHALKFSDRSEAFRSTRREVVEWLVGE